ncbi:hypothetical protein GOODEAATRI_025626 [Goodea atripinnis]|uniref:Uncharacterized protein n=1 Tax=Goodea atripinnis TaxID=208336 RepID=A0ABV0NDK6_9TELE
MPALSGTAEMVTAQTPAVLKLDLSVVSGQQQQDLQMFLQPEQEGEHGKRIVHSMLLGIRDSLLMLPCVRQRSGELPALLALVPEELLWRDPAWDPSKRKCWKSGRRRGTCSGKRVRVRSWIHSIGDSGCFGLLPVYPTSAEQAQLMDYCWSSMRRVTSGC